MADVHSIETRSFNMSRIRSKNTKPEILVRKFLFSKGFRYRIHESKILGKPDIVLKKYKTIIFINGCFWHGHDGCKYYVIPKTRTDWWLDKINKNKIKDLDVYAGLIKIGWNVITIWECELRSSHRIVTLNELIINIAS